MMNFLKDNLLFMIIGWVLGEAYPITTVEFWVWLFAIIIASEIRDRYIRNTGL